MDEAEISAERDPGLPAASEAQLAGAGGSGAHTDSATRPPPPPPPPQQQQQQQEPPLPQPQPMQPTQPTQPPLAETVEPAASSQVVGAAPAVKPAPAVEIHAKISDLKEEPRKWNWTKWAAGLPEGTVTYADLHEKAASYFDLDARPEPDATFKLTYMDEDGDNIRLKSASCVSYMIEQALAGSRTSPVMLNFTLVRLPDRAGPTQPLPPPPQPPQPPAQPPPPTQPPQPPQSQPPTPQQPPAQQPPQPPSQPPAGPPPAAAKEVTAATACPAAVMAAPHRAVTPPATLAEPAAAAATVAAAPATPMAAAPQVALVAAAVGAPASAPAPVAAMDARAAEVAPAAAAAALQVAGAGGAAPPMHPENAAPMAATRVTAPVVVDDAADATVGEAGGGIMETDDAFGAGAFQDDDGRSTGSAQAAVAGSATGDAMETNAAVDGELAHVAGPGDVEGEDEALTRAEGQGGQAKRMRPYSWDDRPLPKDSRVEVQDGSKWYPARVVRFHEASRIIVQYEDKSEGPVDWKRIRVNKDEHPRISAEKCNINGCPLPNRHAGPCQFPKVVISRPRRPPKRLGPDDDLVPLDAVLLGPSRRKAIRGTSTMSCRHPEQQREGVPEFEQEDDGMESEPGELEVEAELVAVEVVTETEEQREEAELNMEDAAQSSADEAASGEASGLLSPEPMTSQQAATFEAALSRQALAQQHAPLQQQMQQSQQVQQLAEPCLTFMN